MRRLSYLLVALGVAALVALPSTAAATLTLQGLGLPSVVTLSGTTWNAVTIPSGTEWLRVRPNTTPVKVGISCTDAAAVGSHYATVPADTTEWIAVHPYGSVCLAGTASATVEVWAQTRGR